jgi:excisionase family DNA binding protein
MNKSKFEFTPNSDISQSSSFFDNQISGGANRESLLTKKDIADYLQISIRTLDTWVCQNKIPHLKIGRAVRFDKKVIDKWLEENSNGH